MKVFIDSDVIIWFLRGDAKAKDFFGTICLSKQHELWIGALQRIEIVFNMRKSEEKETMKFPARLSFTLQSVDKTFFAPAVQKMQGNELVVSPDRICSIPDEQVFSTIRSDCNCSFVISSAERIPSSCMFFFPDASYPQKRKPS